MIQQSQLFGEIYGENEEFLALNEEDQQEVFSQFLLQQQKEYLIALESKVRTHLPPPPTYQSLCVLEPDGRR